MATCMESNSVLGYELLSIKRSEFSHIDSSINVARTCRKKEKSIWSFAISSSLIRPSPYPSPGSTERSSKRPQRRDRLRLARPGGKNSHSSPDRAQISPCHRSSVNSPSLAQTKGSLEFLSIHLAWFTYATAEATRAFSPATLTSIRLMGAYRVRDNHKPSTGHQTSSLSNTNSFLI